MSKWLPSPLLSLVLALFWLVLNQTLDILHLVFGVILGVLLPLWVAPLRPLKTNVRNIWTAIRLGFWALKEITRSCYQVSHIILFSGNNVNSAFIRVPLDLKDPTGLAVLSCLINCTPGTVWIEVDQATHELVLHVFDLQDTDWWIATVKERYEKPLMQIFSHKEAEHG